MGLLGLLAACVSDAETPSVTQIDEDRDDVLGHLDCDDTDPAIGAAPSWFADFDGDGEGDAAFAVASCAAPDGFVASSDDPEPQCATNDTDGCGICAGGDAAKDCGAVCFGGDRLDLCGVCAGPGPPTWYADL
ncbi:MAG: hypothetical protein ACI9MR_005062, partial [Myxococcota bacterium]